MRPTIEGTFGGIYDFKIMPDFGQGRTVIQDAYVTARFNPASALTVGKFKSPVGPRAPAVGERHEAGCSAASRPASRRTATLACSWAANSAAAGLATSGAFLNGSNDGGSSETFADVDVNDDKEYALRLFAHPFAESDSFAIRGLGIGIAGTYTDQTGNATQPLLPSFRTPGQSTFFRFRQFGTTAGSAAGTIADGERTRIAPQLYYYVGSLGLIGEFTEV